MCTETFQECNVMSMMLLLVSIDNQIFRNLGWASEGKHDVFIW